MGWQEAGRLPINFAVRRPLSVALHAARLLKADAGTPQSLDRWLEHPGLPGLLNEARGISMYTAYSVPYLRWRYKEVPVASYGAVGVEQNGILLGLGIYRLKSSRLGVELRLCEALVRSRSDFNLLLRALRKSADGYDYLTLSGLSQWRAGLVSAKAGPVVTVNSLNFAAEGSLLQFQQWSPALGDLELF
jgi:hypothetical protein